MSHKSPTRFPEEARRNHQRTAAAVELPRRFGLAFAARLLMRILIVTHYQPPHRGGIETVAENLVERYRRAGQDVVWLSSDVPPVPAAPGTVRIPAWNPLESSFGVPYPLWHPRGIATVRRWVDWCEVLHCHDCLYPGTVLALRHARRRGKPVLLTQHVAPVPYRSVWLRWAQLLAYRTLGTYVHRRVDCAVFISRVVMQWFLQRVRHAAPPHFIPNGVDTALFAFADERARRDARAGLQLPVDRPVLLFVGRFVDKKGIPIIERLARRRPDCLFVLVGEGPEQPSAWRLDNVLVRPFQTQAVLREYYSASDLLLLPSTGEGFPLVVMEAMACGTPALVSSETFSAWNDGRESFLVADPSADAVAAVIEQKLSWLSATFRQSVADYARRHWDWDHVARQYLQLLEQLAKRSTSPVISSSHE
jgi:glycosyltransferase involved in cell wall biosynthesis